MKDDMLSGKTFLPILNRNDWRGLGTVFTHKLFKEDPGPPGGLLVSYGVVDKDTNTYLTKAEIREKSLDIKEVRRAALQNLISRPDRPKWKLQDAEGAKFLWRGGDESTCSEILLPRILAKVNEHFKAEHAFVAVPNRFCIIASPEPLLLGNVAAGMYEDAVKEHGGALTPLVFMIREGRVMGFMTREGEKPPGPPQDTGMVSRALLLGPLLVFLLLAGSDGNLSQAEMEAFARSLDARARKASKIVSQLLLGSFQSLEKCMNIITGAKDPMELLSELSASLRSDLSPRDRKEYAEILLEMAHAVAAQGARRSLLGRKLGAREKQLLDVLRVMLLQLPNEGGSAS